MDTEHEATNRGRKTRAIPYVIGIIGVAISLLFFSDLSESAIVKREVINPYVLCTKGKTLIVREKPISINEGGSGTLMIGDRVRTLAASSATVFWPDGSVTRLGEKSTIKIHEMHASAQDGQVQIDFSLEQGRTWSNIISYLFGDSYFHERYNDDAVIATVRGTVFEIDLDRRYIHTVDHAVTISDTQSGTKSATLSAGTIIDTLTSRALDTSVLDTAWGELNTREDIEYVNARLERFNRAVLDRFGQKNYFDSFLESIGIRPKEAVPIDSLMHSSSEAWSQIEQGLTTTPEARTTTRSGAIALYSEIQSFPNTQEILSAKIRLRDLIIATAEEEQKTPLLTDFARRTLYDIWSISSSGSTRTIEIDTLRGKM